MGFHRAVAVMCAALGCILFMSSASTSMATKGSFRVTDSGSASYSIPISVPPGIAGVQPNHAPLLRMAQWEELGLIPTIAIVSTVYA